MWGKKAELIGLGDHMSYSAYKTEEIIKILLENEQFMINI